MGNFRKLGGRFAISINLSAGRHDNHQSREDRLMATRANAAPTARPLLIDDSP
jgi:hypothetical protein